MNTKRKASSFVHCVIGISLLCATPALAKNHKVDICHVPPGNPANAHTITVSENAVDAHMAHGDNMGPCVVETTVEESETPEEQAAACSCPKHGVWRVTNLDGWMECNALGIKRTLKGAARNDGAIWILNDDCSTIFSEAYRKDSESVVMHRGRQCLYFGVAPGEESGAEVIFDGAYKLENDEFITGEYHMKMTGMGADCTGYRPFEIEYLEPLSEKKYEKLEKKMQEELLKAQEKQVEHLEQIDEYLVETDGGQAFGGRNPEE